jgi:hypothetical protein
MRNFLLSLLTCAAASSVVHANDETRSAPCTPLPGTESLLSQAPPEFIIMGEAHGTAELPAAFADLVCAFALKGGPLTVGLEFLPEEQSSLNAYLASDGGHAARAALLDSPGWSNRDGRASQAIFGLLESLRRLKTTKPDLQIVAFDHASETPGTSAAREKGMADLLLSAKRARPAAPLLALTGLGHAGKSAWTSSYPPFFAMSQHLPADATMALAFDVFGGEILACRRPAEGAADECGPRAVNTPGEDRPRGVRLDGSRDGFDAILSVGMPFSASAPARTAR